MRTLGTIESRTGRNPVAPTKFHEAASPSSMIAETGGPALRVVRPSAGFLVMSSQFQGLCRAQRSNELSSVWKAS
jgi:hypothetical protein